MTMTTMTTMIAMKMMLVVIMVVVMMFRMMLMKGGTGCDGWLARTRAVAESALSWFKKY